MCGLYRALGRYKWMQYQGKAMGCPGLELAASWWLEGGVILTLLAVLFTGAGWAVLSF